MERFELFIGRCLLVGALICVGVVMIGGSLFLMQHGREPVPAFIYPSKELLQFTSITDILSAATKPLALGIVQLGLLILLMVQLLRVALTTWYFIKLKNKLFVFFSTFILIILILSIFVEF